MGDDRAAPADARRPPRAHRRARGGPDRAGSARARHSAATASRSTSRSWCGRARCIPGRTAPPRRARLGARGALRAARRPALRHPGGAAGRRHRGRRRSRGRPLAPRGNHVDPGRGARRTLRALVDARVLEPVDGRPARYRFRHELLREVAYELQPPSWRRKVHSRLCDLLTPRRAERLAASWRRTSSAPSATDEAAVAYQHTAEWARRRGALDEARSHLTRAIDLVMPLTDDATRDHREVELRLRRGFLAMSAEGAASADASAGLRSLPRAGRGRPRGRRHVQHPDLRCGPTTCPGRAGPRPPGLRDAARRLADERDYFRPQNLAGFGMLDWFAGSFESAVETLAAATDDLAEIGGGRRRRRLVRAQRPHGGDARAPRPGAIHGGRRGGGADDSLAGARAVAASLDFPQGPWSAAYASWLGSWMWIEAGRLDLADEALADLRSSSARHGFDNWELIAATQTAALEALTALRSGPRMRPRCPSTPRRSAPTSSSGRCSGCGCSCPFYLTTAGALLAARATPTGARRATRSRSAWQRRPGMRFYDAETDAAPGPPGPARPRGGGRGAARRARPRPVAGGPALRAADRADHELLARRRRR